MRLTLTIRSSGSAFATNDGRNEAARILRALADDLEAGIDASPLALYDNRRIRVGFAQYEGNTTDG